MDTLSSIAFLVFIIGWLWLTILGFQRGILWGLALFFIPLLPPLAFVASYREIALRPFILYMVGGIGYALTTAAFASSGV